MLVAVHLMHSSTIATSVWVNMMKQKTNKFETTKFQATLHYRHNSLSRAKPAVPKDTELHRLTLTLDLQEVAIRPEPTEGGLVVGICGKPCATTTIVPIACQTTHNLSKPPRSAHVPSHVPSHLSISEPQHPCLLRNFKRCVLDRGISGTPVGSEI